MSNKPRFQRHIDACGYGAPIMDESDAIERLEGAIERLVRAGNAIIRASTQVERVAAAHDWNKAVKEIEK